jgi:Na+/proline symporter
MTPALILTFVAAYTLILFAVTWRTSRGATNESYFVGDRSSRWYLVAYGMIGASLSGVTFMSVPGSVGDAKFFYFQVILGYLVGYFVIAYVLLPLYYRMNLTSIYSYLEKRFGLHAYRTGAFFFLFSRVLGAACRMYIVVLVLQKFVFDAWHVHFAVTTAVFILLIIAYTFKGGVKTIVWTDTLQTTFMLVSLVLSVILITRDLDISGLFSHVVNSEHSQIFNTDWKSGLFFPKAFFGGMFIAITMTGMDQEMMQKNISCRNLGESQKNMITFSFILVAVNLLFLTLGVLIWDFVGSHSELQAALHNPDPSKKMLTDELFPTIALNYLGAASALFFIIGLISAAYPSADGALTALTASFCIDFLGFKNPSKGWSEARQTSVRKQVHIMFAVLLFIAMLVLKAVSDKAIIDTVLFLAAITYGPLLGLFAFGILTKRTVAGWPVIAVCALSPAICFAINYIAAHDASLPHKDGATVFHVFNGYRFGNELLIINGLITFTGLYFISKKNPGVSPVPVTV